MLLEAASHPADLSLCERAERSFPHLGEEKCPVRDVPRVWTEGGSSGNRGSRHSEAPQAQGCVRRREALSAPGHEQNRVHAGAKFSKYQQDRARVGT